MLAYQATLNARRKSPIARRHMGRFRSDTDLSVRKKPRKSSSLYSTGNWTLSTYQGPFENQCGAHLIDRIESDITTYQDIRRP
jgi:hypothetical protein